LRRRFLNEPTPFLHFCNYLPFEEDLALYLNKLEFPFVPSLIEFGLLVLEKIFEIFQCIFTRLLLSSLGEGRSPLLPLPPKDGLCQIWLKLANWFWRRSRKGKSLQTDRQDGQLAIRIAPLSFQLR
jgi:hypothetical protein